MEKRILSKFFFLYNSFHETNETHNIKWIHNFSSCVYCETFFPSICQLESFRWLATIDLCLWELAWAAYKFSLPMISKLRSWWLQDQRPELVWVWESRRDTANCTRARQQQLKFCLSSSKWFANRHISSHTHYLSIEERRECCRHSVVILGGISQFSIVDFHISSRRYEAELFGQEPIQKLFLKWRKSWELLESSRHNVKS